MKKILLSILLCAFACAQAGATVFYQKVKTDQADWSGEYLIVKEVDSLSQGIVFDGSLTEFLNKKNNCFTVSISDDDCITSNQKTDGATFTIAKQADGTYTIRAKSGYYIGAEQADSASMTTKKNTPLYNTIRFESDTTTKVKIQAPGGYVLRYNNDPASNRFRFYAEGKKKAIHLYKKVDTTDIENIPMKEGELIDGRLYGLPAGIYIKDGKKIYIKD